MTRSILFVLIFDRSNPKCLIDMVTVLQASLLPNSIEDYIGENDPVRVYDQFVDKVNFSTIGIEDDTKQVGNSKYDPRSMLRLLLYGYSYGIRSSRKLEQALHHNLSFYMVDRRFAS